MFLMQKELDWHIFESKAREHCLHRGMHKHKTHEFSLYFNKSHFKALAEMKLLSARYVGAIFLLEMVGWTTRWPKGSTPLVHQNDLRVGC